MKCSVFFLDSGRLQIVFIAEHQRKQRLLGTSAPAVFRCVFRAEGAGLYRIGKLLPNNILSIKIKHFLLFHQSLISGSQFGLCVPSSCSPEEV